MGVGGASPPETYDLAAASVAKNGGAAPVFITVATPSTIRPLDSEQILVRDESGKLTYFQGSAWGDRLPRLVRARLVQALTDSGRFRAVGTNEERVAGDVTLSLELRSFNIEVTNGGSARAVVDVVAKLIDERSDRVIASRQFSADAPAAKDDAASGVAALNQAFADMAAQVVAWSANPRSA
jgi:cholesterol transport system auxiliary component